MQTSPAHLSDSPGKQRKRKRSKDDSASVGQEHGERQLPSPSLTKLDKCCSCPTSPRAADFGTKVHNEHQPNTARIWKRIRLSSDSKPVEAKLDWWLSQLGEAQEEAITFVDDMSRPPSKRSRSSDTPGDGSDSSQSRGRADSLYQNTNYPVVLETKGIYMRPSKADMTEQDKVLCKRLLAMTQTIEEDHLFDRHFEEYHNNLRGRSEARICTDLHPRLAPSVENLFITGRKQFSAFIEGYNDAWTKAIPVYGPRPQPDHTYGFKWNKFTEVQRRKLKIDPSQKSYYTAREDVFFPFLTAEVKCGRQGLDLAERPNMHSMSVALRGVVDLYRRAGRAAEVHRRVLGFSISHDDTTERIHAYYPEVDGDETTYWRKVVKEFVIGSEDGAHRWASYHFTLNVCELFALPLLERLKQVIDELPDPASQSAELTTTLEEYSVESSQENTILPSSREGSSRKQSGTAGLSAELRSTIQSLRQQLQSQGEEKVKILGILEQQKKSSEEQQKRAEEQQKRAEEQQKRAEEQQKSMQQQMDKLMGMLSEQRK